MNRPIFYRFGLKGKILLSLAIMVIYALVFMGFIGVRISESFIVREKLKEVSLLYDILSATISQTQGSVADALLSFIRRKGIEAYILKDGEGRILLKGGKEEAMTLLSAAGLREGVSFPERSWLGMGDKVVYMGRLEGRDRTYTMGIVLSIKDIRKELGYVGRVVILYIFAYGLLILLGGYFLLNHHVIKPMKDLEGFAKRIADGELEGSIRMEGPSFSHHDEIGSLASSLERMRVNLVEKIDALKKRNQEIMEMQSQIVHAEKMASIGRLASAVAHEIGNPLGVILGYMDILHSEADAEKKDIIERVGREIERVKETIGRLLDLSRPLKGKALEVDVNRVVGETVEFMKASLKGIDVRLDLSQGLPPVRIDPRGLEQVLVNLILNARDAMPQGGRLTILTRVEEGYRPGLFLRRRKTDPPHLDFTEKRRLPQPLKGARRWVKVIVEDTGCGMDEKTVGQIFNPFFTTKGPDRGTGLGLFISLGIVQAFGGDIEVKSKKGKGSTFKVLLPVW